MILFQLDSRGINQVIAYNANHGSMVKSNQGLYLDGMITEEKIISRIYPQIRRNQLYVDSHSHGV
jgi:hypothetical protein